MSTFNQSHQPLPLPRGGRRQPFGSLHANTLPPAEGGPAGDGDGADPVKSESQRKFRGVLTSIVSRGTSNNNNNKGRGRVRERWSRSSSTALSTTNTEYEELEPRAVAAAPPREETVACRGTVADGPHPRPNHDGFVASEVAAIFRPGGHWDSEMEDMLTLRQANPISDENVVRQSVSQTGKEDEEAREEEKRVDPSAWPAGDFDQRDAGAPLFSRDCLHEGEEGFKIYADTGM